VASPRIYTVSELVGGANRAVEAAYSSVWVEGEVSNLRIVASGHAYFTLKDPAALLPVAIWRSALARLRFRLADGQRLRVAGRLGIYPQQGKFQLYADRAEPAGLGALMLQLEQLKAKLSAEGLFAAARRRPLPTWPRVIGVVTSATGAAIHDILKVTARRCPSRILLAPALVQGDEAPASLLAALRRLQTWPGVDVIILGRGGGASEDLWAFNDEALVRAVAACPVPVIAAIGHEVDVTLCDFAADLRAATPSHAAELVVPDLQIAARRLVDAERHLALAFRRRLLDERSRLELAHHRLLGQRRALIAGPRRRLDLLERRLSAQHPRRRLSELRRRLAALLARLGDQHPRLRVLAARRRLDTSLAELERIGRRLSAAPRVRLARAAGAVDALSPLRVLARGYAVATDAQGRALTDAAALAPGDNITLRLHRGELEARVEKLRPALPGAT